MNIIIDQPKLVKIAKLFLTKNFGNLTLKTNDEKPDLVFFTDSDGEFLMEYNKKRNAIWIHYDKMWSQLEIYFNFTYPEIQKVFSQWLEETYNLKDVTPLDFGWEDA